MWCAVSGLERTVFGVHFPNPIGLAAGFDKDAVAVDKWAGLGFGFVEVGTVTWHPQPGNPKPRMFRLPAERALINRLGFNNSGAEAMARRLESARPGIPLGVNIGKSKVVELEAAAADYLASFRLLAPFADYVVVNVSSPNTPGLRQLQERPRLTALLSTLREARPETPLLVKVAPDLTLNELDDVVAVAVETGLAGIVATNTTVSRPLHRDPGIEGGLSGAPLREMADTALEHLAVQAPAGLGLVGVGGVMSGQDAQRKLRLGASLVQVYTGFVYGGPGFATEVCRGLVSALAGKDDAAHDHALGQ
jgi:dihydroorotate dehydrogenase